MLEDSKLDRNSWVPVVELDSSPAKRSLGTQTVGIFYHSAKTIDSQKTLEFTQKMLKTSTNSRQVSRLSGPSPGRGLWRMQLEHLCTHLKAH